MLRAHHILIPTSVALFAASCASPAPTRDEQLIEGFDPPPPREGEIRVHAPLVDEIPPSADLTWCSYIPNPFGREVDVVQSRGFQSAFGHHAILMEVPGAEDRIGQSHPCTERDMTNARFLAGGSDAAAQFQIPDGVGFRVKKSAALMVQSHWINASAKAARGQTVFNVKVEAPDPNRHAAQLFATFTADVDIPPRGPARAHAECKLQKDLQLFALGGHAHEYGTHVRLTIERGGKRDMLYDHDWEPHYQADPPLDYYDTHAPLVLRAGETLHVDCEYKNDTDAPLRFPREMCVGMGFYFPGDADIQCGDGHWSTTGIGGAP